MNWLEQLIRAIFGIPAPAPTPAPAPPPPGPGPGPTPTDRPAWWATPVADLQPGDPDLAYRLRWADSSESCGERWATEFGLVPMNSYAIPVYDAAEATMTVEVRRKAGWPGIFNIAPGERIPWNPDWRPSSGKDAYMLIVDRSTGHEWGLWNASWWSYPILGRDPEWQINNSLQAITNPANWDPPFGAGFNPDTMVAAASAYQVRDPQGRPVDTRTWRGNFPGACGGGWQLGPLVVTSEEVEAGHIGHALHFYSANTMDRPAKGDDPMTAVAPAGQIEGGDRVPDDVRARQIPEGTRFSLELTDAERQAWARRKSVELGGDSRTYQTVKTLLDALCDYGWFLGDSSPNAAFWVFDGSPRAQQRWRQLGVPTGNASKRVLAGIPFDRIRVWAPPVATLTDGTQTTGYGRATAIEYPA